MKQVLGDTCIELTDSLKNLLKNRIRNEGGVRKYASVVGLDPTHVSRFVGTQNPIQAISWELWPQIREDLESHGAIVRGDPRWMLPSEMRAALMRGEQHPPDPHEDRLLNFFRVLNADGKEMLLEDAEKYASRAATSNSSSSAPPASVAQQAG